MSGTSRMSQRGNPLDKKIPKNKKYEHVRSTLDTGASLSKYMNKIEEIRKNYKFRKDEIFKRMKCTTFVQLVLQVAQVSAEELYNTMPPTPYLDSSRAESTDLEIRQIQGDTGGGGDCSPVPSLAVTEGDYGAKSVADTSRSTLQRLKYYSNAESMHAQSLLNRADDSVAAGVGELDLRAPPVAPKNNFVDDAYPYLLLDVREKDEYDTCHIITASSYPKAFLSRAVNYESKEMLAYKNIPGKIIIIYDDDERIAPHAATTLVQRGYDNLFMLSGGLKVASKIIPEGLICGTLSASLTGGKPRVQAPADQKHFTADDINMMEMYLDNALQDNSVGSRLSSRSGASTASSRISRKSAASDSKPPFR